MSLTSPRADQSARVITDDSNLVRRARGGDLAAFSELVERHRAVVYRVAARMVGADDADDVAQEAFLRAFHRLDRFRGDAPFLSWLLRIAHNAALDTLARRQRDPRPGEEPVGEDQPETAPVHASTSPKTPADALEESERRSRLEHKLERLRPTHRAVLVLRDLEGLPYDEIADVTETPLGSVKARLHRARAELIEILRTNTYDWELPDER